jgi:hypothetical protein
VVKSQVVGSKNWHQVPNLVVVNIYAYMLGYKIWLFNHIFNICCNKFQKGSSVGLTPGPAQTNSKFGPLPTIWATDPFEISAHYILSSRSAPKYILGTIFNAGLE